MPCYDFIEMLQKVTASVFDGRLKTDSVNCFAISKNCIEASVICVFWSQKVQQQVPFSHIGDPYYLIILN